MRFLILAVVLLVGACGTPQRDMTLAASPLIDQPTPPFPYNSRFCP